MSDSGARFVWRVRADDATADDVTKETATVGTGTVASPAIIVHPVSVTVFDKIAGGLAVDHAFGWNSVVDEGQHEG